MSIKAIYSLIFTAAIATLAGCGGSASSEDEPSSVAKTVFKIANLSSHDFASVTIKNASGMTTYEGAFRCRGGDAACYINLNENYNETLALIFKDANQKMLRAVLVADTPDTDISLAPSATSTGLYLVHRLSEELSGSEAGDWESLNLRLGTFFNNYYSPDGTLDSYEEVGLYYDTRLRRGVTSESEFLNDFKQRLLKWDVATADELPASASKVASLYQRLIDFLTTPSPLIRSAVAQEATCGDGLKGFLNISENLGSIIPIVGDAVSGVAGIAGNYCDDTDAKLDRMIGLLNDLQVSVSAVDRNLGKLTSFLADGAANAKTSEFQRLAIQARNLDSEYRRFLRENRVKSLQEFFEGKDWDQAIASGGRALQSILNAPYLDSSNGGIYTRILDATSLANFDTYIKALSAKCASLPTSSSSNFIITRQQCNNIILSNSGMLVASQGIVLPIFRDIYETLNKNKEKAKNIYLLPEGLTSYESAYMQVIRAFSDQQAEMVRDYKSQIGVTGYFNAFQGLNEDLVNSLARRQCMQDGSDRRNSPAIVGWYAPSTYKREDYIETYCKVGNRSDRLKARYYYGDQGSVDANNVANVLGVPVAYEYIRDGKPLYKSQANISREDYPIAGPFNLETRNLVTFGVGSAEVISIGASNVREIGTGTWEWSNPDPVYVVMKSKDRTYHHVARIQIETIKSTVSPIYAYTVTQISCIAAPCRVDPNTGEWLIFTDDNETLDLWYTGQRAPTSAANVILRLGPVGSR